MRQVGKLSMRDDNGREWILRRLTFDKNEMQCTSSSLLQHLSVSLLNSSIIFVRGHDAFLICSHATPARLCATRKLNRGHVNVKVATEHFSSFTFLRHDSLQRSFAVYLFLSSRFQALVSRTSTVLILLRAAGIFTTKYGQQRTKQQRNTLEPRPAWHASPRSPRKR